MDKQAKALAKRVAKLKRRKQLLATSSNDLSLQWQRRKAEAIKSSTLDLRDMSLKIF
jgi:hypothetical protein